MYGKILNLKFANMEEAKLAASFFTENIASKISALKIVGFNVFIGQQGDMNVLIKFESVNAVKVFEGKYPDIIKALRRSLVFKETVFVGVCAFTFEQEAALTEG
tara:strand:- start:1319 stop:1630 length:312 start_codon:yes stop_codon:yes gene_type:complete